MDPRTEGAIDVCRELLRHVLTQRDDASSLADAGSRILEDLYEGDPLRSAGSHTLSLYVARKQAEAAAAQETSDTVEAILGELVKGSTPSMSRATMPGGGSDE